MPPLSYDQASLDEILEVRGAPLSENEVWSILLEGAITLKSILSRTKNDKLVHLALTFRPDIIVLCLNGRIKLAIFSGVGNDSRFVAPESFSLSKPYNDGRIKTRLEKMLVYSFGMCMFSAIEYGVTSCLNYDVSNDLESVLCRMVEEKTIARITVAELIKNASSYIDTNSCYKIISSLASEIVGPYGLEALDSLMSLKLPDPLKPINIDQLENRLINSDTDSIRIRTNDEDDFDKHEKENYINENSHQGIIRKTKPLKIVQALSNNKGRVVDFKDFDAKYPISDDAEEELYPMKENLSQSSPPIKGSLIPRALTLTNQTSMKLPPRPQLHVSSPNGTITNKPWSPSFSNPDFKNLVELENRKLVEGGFLKDTPRVISTRKIYKSMPALNKPDADDDGDDRVMNETNLMKRSESLQASPHNKGVFGFDDRHSLHSQTTHYSSQVSLTHGGYVLDAGHTNWRNDHNFLKRSISDFSAQSEYESSQPTHRDWEIDPKLQGPEFIRVESDPELAFINISPPRLGPVPKGSRPIFVILPNSQKVETIVQVSSKVKELYDQIALHLGLREMLYFGLTQLKDDEYMFLDLETKLLKYAPSGWKEENPKKRKADFILHFKVKFFVEEPKLLKHNLTVHLFYLQLRHDIINNFIYCPDDVCIKLSGYALLAEYGPYRNNPGQYFQLDHYLPHRLVQTVDHDQLFHKLSTIHQQLHMNSHSAELAFLNEAKLLSEYGVLFHKVSRSKKIETDIVWLGICIKGIVILEPKGQQKVTVHKQAWHLIKEFNFEKKKFIIKPKNSDIQPKMTFYTNHYRRSKYLFRMCQSFHRFQLFSQTQALTQPAKEPFPIATNITPQKNYLDVYPDITRNVTVQVCKKPNEILGITIVGGEDSNRIKPGIFIKDIKPNSVCAKDERLAVGDRILSVNGVSLASVTHDAAVNVLKKSGEKIVFVIQKYINKEASILDKSGLSPNVDYTSMIRDDVAAWQSDKPISKEELKNKLSGISVMNDDKMNRGENNHCKYNERCVDVPNCSCCRHSNDPHPVETSPKLSPKIIPIVNGIRLDDADDADDDEADDDDEGMGVGAEIAGQPGEVIHGNNHQHDDSWVDSDDELSESMSKNAQPSNLKRFPAFESLNNLDESPYQSDSGNHGNRDKAQLDVTDAPTLPSSLDATLEKGRLQSGNEKKITLHKVNGSLGISVMGGVDSHTPLGGIYVKSIQARCQASKHLQVGDELLSVNGKPLYNLTHQQAVDVIKECGNTVNIVYERPQQIFLDSTVSAQSSPATSRSNVFEVEVEKVSDGLGLVIAGGSDADQAYRGMFMIKKIFPGQPIDNSGKFQKGDIIIAINDQLLEGLSHKEALSVIRNVNGRVKIIAKRPSTDDIPEDLFITSRPVSPEKLLKDLTIRASSVEGRTSREGNRLAKQFLKSMTFKDDSDHSFSQQIDSVNDFSSIDELTEKVYDNIDGVDSDDVVDDIDNDPPTHHGENLMTTKLLIKQKIDNENINQSITPEKDKVVTEKETKELETLKRNNTYTDSEIIMHKVERGELSEDNTDTTIGLPRHRPSLEDNEEVFYLIKDSNSNHGLAFENINGYLTITNVEIDSPADKQKVFRPGQVVVSINDVITSGFDHPKTEKLIRKLSSRLKFKVTASNNQTNDEISLLNEAINENTTNQRTSKYIDTIQESSIKESQEIKVQSKNEENNVIPIELEKQHEVKNNMSKISSTSQIYSPVTASSPTMTIKSSPSSPKLKCLNAKGWARIDNGKDCDRSSKSSNGSTAGEVILVQLDKGDNGLGITLATGTLTATNESFVFIRSILENSVAAKNGELKIGDRLVGINGENVENYSQKEIVGIFRNLQHGNVTIECYRAPDILVMSPQTSSIPKNHSHMTPDSLKLPSLPTNNTSAELTQATSSKNDVIPMDDFNASFLEASSPALVTEMESEFINQSESDIFNTDDNLSFLTTNSSDEASSLDSDMNSNMKKSRDKTSFLVMNKKALSPIESVSASIIDDDISRKSENFEASDNRRTGNERNIEREGVVDNNNVEKEEIRNDKKLKKEKVVNNEESVVKDKRKGDHMKVKENRNSENNSPRLSLDYKLKSPPPPEDLDEMNSSVDFDSIGSELDRPIPGMDTDGIIHSSDIDSIGNDSDDVFENDKPERKLSTDSSLMHKSQIPRFTRIYSNSDNDSPKAKRKSPKNSGSLSDRLIEREEFVYFNKEKINKIINSIDVLLQPENLSSEYSSYRQLKVNESCDVANRVGNRTKNRNKLVVPYDFNRVVLTGGEEFDYINASLLKVPIGEKKISIIVGQSPVEATLEDFWRCIWENKIEAIAMLTQANEGGKEKCFPYWPVVSKEPMKLLDKFEVELLFEEDCDSFIYRQIQLRNIKMDKSLFIMQATFNAWPINGVPENANDILGYVKFIRSFQNCKTVFVHDSVGVGRCGVYVTLHCVWEAIETDTKFDVNKLFRCIKEQRQQIIQTKDQYRFTYEAIRVLLNDLRNHQQ